MKASKLKYKSKIKKIVVTKDSDPISTYPEGFFELFGSGTKDDDFDEIEDLPLTKKENLE